MIDRIQIAPLKKDYQRIIDFDRKHPASKIVVFVRKCDTKKKTKDYKQIETSLKKLREYCQLTKIQFNMQVIDCFNKNSLLEVILDFARALMIDYNPNFTYLLNLGEDSLLMNISLLQAAQIVQSIYDKDFSYFISDSCLEQEHFFEKRIVKSFGRLISEPVSLELLVCVNEGKNLEEIKSLLNISLGSVSNHLKRLKEINLIDVQGHDRKLTDLGILVKEILELTTKIDIL
ncbi:MAG: hypothetical protein ACTSO7_07555 [Candidatus Heimdallarchaeota archaeon]